MTNIPRILSVFFLSLFISLPVLASTIKNSEKVDQLSNQFMQLVKQGKVNQAYKTLSPYISIGETKFLEVGNKAATYITRVQAKIGNPLAVNEISSKKIGNDLIRKLYLLKYSTATLVWELTFYQPVNGWLLIGVNYSTNIDALFR